MSLASSRVYAQPSDAKALTSKLIWVRLVGILGLCALAPFDWFFRENEAKLLFYFGYNSLWFTGGIIMAKHRKNCAKHEDSHRRLSSHNKFANFIFNFFLLSLEFGSFFVCGAWFSQGANLPKKAKRSRLGRSSITFHLNLSSSSSSVDTFSFSSCFAKSSNWLVISFMV